MSSASPGSRVHSGSRMSSVIPRLLAAVNTLSSRHIFLKPISAHDLVEAYIMDLGSLTNEPIVLHTPVTASLRLI